MKNIKISVDYSTIGSEILKSISERSRKSALDSNIRQAKKYLAYCITTGDSALIEYAQKRLSEITC